MPDTNSSFSHDTFLFDIDTSINAFQRRFELYYQILHDTRGNTPASEQYASFINNLFLLNAKISEDSEKTLSGREIVELRNLYDNALKATDDYIALKDNSRLDNRCAYIAEEIRRLLIKDMRAFDTLNKNQSYSLNEIFGASRDIRLDITGSLTGSRSGAVSTRVPIAYRDTDDNIREGFFTQNTYITDSSELLRAWKEQNPEYEAFLSAWENMDDKNNFVLYVQAALYPSMLSPNAKNPLLDTFDEETLKRYAADPIVNDWFDKYTKHVQYMNTYMASGSPLGGNISDRNCAMTSVAALLGLNDILAPSYKVTVLNNGIPASGCFMSTAPGSDINHLTQNDPMIKWAQNAQNTPPRISNDALRQIADLQVLDYICANIDRHKANVFYQFAGDSQNPELVGITGIDNDLSFLGQQAFRSNQPDHITVISQSMADRVMALEPNTLQFALHQYNLSDNEIQAAQNRLTAMQERILRARHLLPDDPYQVPDLAIVADEQFHTLPPQALYDANNPLRSLFGRIMQDATDCITNSFDLTVLPAENKRPPYAGAVLGATQPLDLRAVREKFAALKTKLDAQSKAAWWNTDEFQDMHKALTNLFTKNTQNIELLKAVQTISNQTVRYINQKRNIPRTPRGRARLSLARELLDLCADTRKQMVTDSVNAQQPVASFAEQTHATLNYLAQPYRDGFAAAVQSNNTAQMTENLSSLLAIGTMMHQVGKKGNGNLLQELNADSIAQQAARLRTVAVNYLNNTPKERLKYIISRPNMEMNLINSCMKGIAERKNMQANIPAAKAVIESASEVKRPRGKSM